MKKFLTFIIVAVLVIGGYKWFSEKTPAEVEEPVMEESTTEQVDVMLDSEAGDFELNTEESTLRYTAKKIVGHGHTGTVNLKSGTLSHDGESFTTGEFVIDMKTITDDEDSQGYLKHVRNADFFDVEAYPEASFTLTSAQYKDGKYEVVGDLTIKDKTNSITFVTDIGLDEQLIAKAAFNINRTLWDITYGSGSFFDDLGDGAINDDITFELSLTFDRK